MSRIYAAVRPSAAANGVSTHDDASRKESTRTPTVNVTVTVTIAVVGVSVSVGVGGRDVQHLPNYFLGYGTTVGDPQVS